MYEIGHVTANSYYIVFLISFESDAEEIFNNNRVLQTDRQRKFHHNGSIFSILSGDHVIVSVT